MKKIIVLGLLMSSVAGGYAQDLSKLDIKLTGRALVDVAAYNQNDAAEEQDGKMNEGVTFRDIRIGFRATYEKFTMRADISVVNEKVALKDVYLQYSFNKNNFLRGGHFTVPFGLSSAYSSAKKEYMDEPEANLFQPGRRVGIMHTVWNKPLWFQYGVFGDNSALSKSTNESGPQGYTVAGRFVWRPVMNEDGGFHVGFSGLHRKAEATTAGNHATVSYNKRYLTAVDKRSAMSVNLNDARWENKFTAEFQGIYRNWQLSSQYYWSHVGRDNDNSYNSDGFYVSARGIIVNPANYKYNYGGSGVDNPSNKNLELALGYGYLDLKDSKAIANSYIAGMANAGKMQDVTAGLSFFWNKNVTFRLNYHHIWVQNQDASLAKKQVDVIQARVQYLF